MSERTDKLLETIYRSTGRSRGDYSKAAHNLVLFRSTGEPDSFKNSELTALIALKPGDTPDNEISGRWSIAPHYGNNVVMCYDLGFNMKTGRTRWRYEDVHPNYTDALGMGDVTGTPMETDRYMAIKFVRRNEGNGVRLEVWQQAHDDWKKLLSVLNTRHIVNDYPNGAEVALKVKDERTVADIAWAVLTEITP